MGGQMGDRVKVTVTGGVADVRLNRPEKLNALDPAMFDALAAAAEQVAADPSARAVVLSGEGRGFCAGLDVAAFAAMAGAESDRGGDGGFAGLTERPLGRVATKAQQAAWAWTELAVPVIAAVHGVAYGGGLQIALAADLRLVTPDARLSIMEVRWGIIPDMTGTYQLPRLIRPDVAKELVWTGRTVGGEEAQTLGLATRVTNDPRADALALAAQIAARSPDAIRASKALLNESLGRTAAEQLAAEQRLIRKLLGRPNQMEAIRAALDDRPGAFSDPRAGDVF